MTRTLFAVATALLSAATLFAPAAQACISCNYVPEVVNTPVRGAPVRGAKTPKKRIEVANKEMAAPAKKRVAKPEPVTKKAAVAEAAPAETQPETVNATSTVKLADAGDAPTEETNVASVGCKKFFPTVGKTVTVPCE